jgi:hypothetical protein
MSYFPSCEVNKQRDKAKDKAKDRTEDRTEDKAKPDRDRTKKSGQTAAAWTAWTWAQKSPAGVNLRGDNQSLNDSIR